ncbi:hypothetical protein GCM10008015_30090 [Flavobacterium palustre]|uniref:Uncharacterized protein n=2 Tax=Flavobacterium palustre TaxID=1476463 RepID=A0ABQ1HRP5_9FLAO|nr:hypothetical protein GCM10008015_30090 [Flavobacterium palustre]
MNQSATFCLGILEVNESFVQLEEIMIKLSVFCLYLLLKKLLTFVAMYRKSIYILFLFIACFIQLGHSLFPHTHIVEHHHDGKHHHHHEEQSDESPLSLLFSHFNHSSDTFSNSQLEEVVKIIKEVPNQDFVLNSTSVFTDSIGYYNKNEVVRNNEPLIFISPHLHSLQFRGPPTIFS